jgi:hypothetical protein
MMTMASDSRPEAYPLVHQYPRIQAAEQASAVCHEVTSAQAEVEQHRFWMDYADLH